MGRIRLSIIFLLTGITSLAKSQTNDLIEKIKLKLENGKASVSNILSDTALMYLHPITDFREVIKQNARQEKITLISPTEPGTKITVKGLVVDKFDNPVADKLVYVYQTSSRGWYSDTAAHILQNEGDRRHARLFGYFKTDSDGKFEFTTIKPQGYPKSTLPAHIHIEIMVRETTNFISELQFDDDPRLVGEVRARSIREGFLIEKNTGTNVKPVYFYKIQVSK